jgi:hypothetical protein
VVPYTRYILKNVKVYKVPEYLIIPLHDGRANFFLSICNSGLHGTKKMIA